MALSRRAALAAGFGLAACSRAEPPPPPPATPPSYSYLTPLIFAVGRFDVIAPTDPAVSRVIQPAPLRPVDVVMTMGRDRITAAGGPGSARFTVLAATLTRDGGSGGGVFTGASERLSCVMRCRIEIMGDDGMSMGFAEAEVRRTAVRPAGSQAERIASADEIVRQAGQDLNVEFEYQIRRNLRSLLRAPAPPGEVLAPPVETETLPRT